MHRLFLFLASILLLAAPLSAQNNFPYNGVIPIPGTLQAEHYDFGGNGVAWFDTSLGNAFGVLRMEDMDVGPIPGGGYHIGVIEPGEWAEYTVNVSVTGTYTVTLRWASDYASPTSFRLLQDGVQVASQTVTKTSLTAGDWHRYLTKTFSVNLTAGQRILRVEFTQGTWNFDSMVFTAQSCSTPVFTQQPSGLVANSPGGTHTLTAAATNAASYQWFQNGQPRAGATSSSFALTNLEEGDDGGDWFVQVTNACGTPVNSNTVRIRVRCSASPGLNTLNIYRALTPPLGDYCDWVEDISPNFPFSNTDTNGSYNRPVVSAAVAFIKEPVRNSPTGKSWDMVNWWTAYLEGELGLRGTAWFYGGSEMGSYTYSHFNVISVMAVHHWATRPNQTPQIQNIGALAQRWLRATFTLHALAAVPSWPLTKHSESQFQAMGNPYNGPFVAMAGERSNWAHWNDSHRGILFSRAVAWTPATNEGGENPNIKSTRQRLEALKGLAVYGLSDPERTTLRNIVTAGTLPANLVSYYLGSALRTKTRYHFAAWETPERVRATWMDSNAHNFTAPTMGVVFFTNARAANGREAHFLYPWAGAFGSGSEAGENITTATAFLDFTNRFVEATNNGTPGSLPHGLRTVRVSNLPALANRKYWVTINPEVNLAPTVRVP